jgi:transcriptional regulator with XRE-family HTH domain
MTTRLRVKEIALAKGWTQTKLQRAADVHPTTMQGIFNNPHRDVSYTILMKIAKVLGVEISELIEEISEEK